MMTYPKTPNLRPLDPDRRVLQLDRFSTPELELLAHLPGWQATEKVDGMNIRIWADLPEDPATSYAPVIRIRGRTDQATLPGRLFSAIWDHFTPDRTYALATSRWAVVYGEGVGPKIGAQGHLYGPYSVILFDAFRSPNLWATPEELAELANTLGLRCVTTRKAPLRELESQVQEGRVHSEFGSFPAEGIVAVAPGGLLDRFGGRIKCKLKTVRYLS